MVLRVDHHDESMVDTSFTCALAGMEASTHTAMSSRTARVIFEVLLKFFILMWFVSYSPVSTRSGLRSSSVADVSSPSTSLSFLFGLSLWESSFSREDENLNPAPISFS